ncbi:MAG: LssY C-terminal domain-containing protein [Gemmatimonadetes bacterium]|nr:LssY C-terminal domain-containing protein [Gemmatimonadota bacterium]
MARPVRVQPAIARCALVTLLACHVASAQEIAAGTRLRVRLDDPVSTAESQPGDTVRAHVIAADTKGISAPIPPRTRVLAIVRDVRRGDHGGARHVLALDFMGLRADDGTVVPIRSRLDEVHDARETLDSAGHILGLPSPVSMRSRRLWALMLLASAHPAAAAILFGALDGVDLERHRATRYARGTDLTIVLLDSALLSAPSRYSPPRALEPADSLVAMVAGLPRRAQSLGGAVQADIANLAFVGDSAALDDAFVRADWARPDEMGVASLLGSFVAEAAARGYARQPVSVLLLDGRPPVRVFQRVNNTFAKRHHVRVWRTRQCWHGRPVWVGAGTHDIGIAFSATHRTFTHQVDPRIDLERNIIVEDLIAADAVVARRDVPLGALPGATVNLDHTPVVTDGRVAVLELRAAESPAAPAGVSCSGSCGATCVAPAPGDTARSRRPGDARLRDDGGS